MPDLVITILVLLILIGLNALYVLAEFSTVSSRRARLTQLSNEGNSFAHAILTIVENPVKLDAYVATSQVGITVSSLILGFYGQARLSPYLIPLFEKWGDFSEAAAISVSATIVLIFLTVLQVLFGELIPKNLGIQEPERFSLLTARPLQWSGWIFKPLIMLFNGSGILLMKLLKIDPSSEHGHIHSPEELSILIEESGEGGSISEDEYKLLANTMRMREEMVKKVMIPRAQMLSAPDSLTVSEITFLVSDSPFSRIPIYKETIDNIIGIVHLRDLFCLNNSKTISKETHITEIIRPVLFVPETMQVKEVFSLLQKNQYQVAIILDEYAGTSGLVTLEDLVEEIFGDLQDEFDEDLPPIQILSDTQILIQGDTSINELNMLFGWSLSDQDVDTIGGLLSNRIGRIPVPGDSVVMEGLNFSIEKTKGRAVASVLLNGTEEIIQRYKTQNLL
jgi:CBS domain containing-hemolysin-like protein